MNSQLWYGFKARSALGYRFDIAGTPCSSLFVGSHEVVTGTNPEDVVDTLKSARAAG